MPKTKKAILGPMLWLATDGEVRIATTLAEFPATQKAMWLCAPGAVRNEPPMTLEECVMVREELTAMSKRNPDARIYTPFVTPDDPIVQANDLSRSGRPGLQLAQFMADVRFTLLRHRAYAKAKEDAKDAKETEDGMRGLFRAIFAKMRDDAKKTGDYDTERALEGDLEKHVDEVLGKKETS